jgi:hypothetical protein
MIRRALLVCIAVCTAIGPLCVAAATDGDREVETALANALHNGDSKTVLQLFDPKMAGYAGIRTGIERLLEAAEVDLDVDTETDIWSLRIVARDAASGITQRKAKVSIHTEGGLIHSFQPPGFFAPPHGREAWDTLFAFAAELQNEDAQPPMEQFDRSMPGYNDLTAAITALWTRYQIEPSLDLKSNEGDDTHRTLQIDWILTLKNPQDPVDSSRREQSIIAGVEKRGKAWRIVSFSHPGFFTPPPEK